MNIAKLVKEDKYEEMFEGPSFAITHKKPECIVLLNKKTNIKMNICSDYRIIYDPSNGNQVIIGQDKDTDPFSLNYPVLMDIGIMGHCKNKCAICYQGSSDQEHMKLDDYKMIMVQSVGMVNEVALGGRGDPNHHPNFEDILISSLRAWIIPNYTTSGIGLTEEQAKITKKHCGAVAVSMIPVVNK